MNKIDYSSQGKLLLVVLFAVLSQACTINVPVNTPNPSSNGYSVKGNAQAKDVEIENHLPKTHEVSVGFPAVALKHDGSDLNTYVFVSNSLESELKARGVITGSGNNAANKIQLKNFEVLSSRTSGFSPMVTISTANLELITDKGTNRIAAMVKRAKLPVWSMSEVNEPCYSQPIEILIKELAAKINQKTTNYSLSDAEVDDLVKKIKAEADSNDMIYFDVYELGFSNNPKAIPHLIEFSKLDNEYVRLAAISGLGTIGATDSFGHLQSIYKTSGTWQDRGMALKAIADLNNQQSLDFLKTEQKKWQGNSSKEGQWNSKIISLYLD